MSRPINSDALGEKGEHRFAELCAEAGLFANKVGRDRTGWDFNLEFPFRTIVGGPSLDHRLQPTECRVQVKTVWSNATNVKLRLSSAERLAKWRGPAFVIVLVVNARTLAFEAMYGLHVRGEVSSLVLKSLRECERKDSTQVNQRYVRLNHSHAGERLDVTGSTLKEYMCRLVVPDLDSYVREKLAEAESLGVQRSRFSINMTLSAADEAEIADVMLGLKRGKAERFIVEETKWGITLPVSASEEASEVSISPAAHKSNLILRGTPGEVVRESVNIYFPADAGIKQNFSRVRITGDYFEFLLDQASAQFSFSTSTADAPGLTLGMWRRFAKAQSILRSGGTLELKARHLKAIGLTMIPEKSNVTLEQVRFLQALLLKLGTLADAAGSADLRATARELEAAANQVEFLHEVLTSPGTARINPIKLAPQNGFPENLGVLDCLFVGRIPFGSIHMAWCAVGLVEARYESSGNVTFEVGDISLRHLELLEGGDVAYEDFRGLVQDETSIRLLVDVGQVSD